MFHDLSIVTGSQMSKTQLRQRVTVTKKLHELEICGLATNCLGNLNHVAGICTILFLDGMSRP